MIKNGIGDILLRRKKMNKRNLMLSLFLCLTLFSALFAGCSNNNPSDDKTKTTQENVNVDDTDKTTQDNDAVDPTKPVDETTNKPTTIMVAAAASLEKTYTEKLIPMFKEKYDWITVEGTYGSSGNLQTQIEEGLGADIFMSAATKQMDALKEKSLVDADSIVELLENKIVLIIPSTSTSDMAEFADIIKANTIALGDPESVPAGQYAKEALTSLGLWDQVEPKLTLGTDVTQVLSWVAEASADAGVVYATDAASNNNVKVIKEAPEGSLAQKVIYPVGMVSASAEKDAAQLFLDFLSSEEALTVFEEYGFTRNE